MKSRFFARLIAATIHQDVPIFAVTFFNTFLAWSHAAGSACGGEYAKLSFPTVANDAEGGRPDVPSVYFKGEMRPVIARLGHGTQATVYLVDTPRGLRTAKVFRTRAKFTSGLREVREWKRNSLPQVMDADEEAVTALFGYREGIPVGVIATDPQASA